MIRIMTFVALALAVSGCTVTDREATYYTRSEVDALAARVECRSMARTIVQIYRCDGR